MEQEEVSQVDQEQKSSSATTTSKEEEDNRESLAHNALPDDAEIIKEDVQVHSTEGNNHEEHVPDTDSSDHSVENIEDETAPSKKRTAEEGLSQRTKRTKHMSRKSKVDQNLMDDEINLIALQFGVRTEDALTQFQKYEQKYMKEMEEEIVRLRNTILQLHIEPSPMRDPTDLQTRPVPETPLDSQRMVTLKTAALRQWVEDHTKETLILCLNKLSLHELYHILQETQLEL